MKQGNKAIMGELKGKPSDVASYINAKLCIIGPPFADPSQLNTALMREN